jgi:hypothetical protein
MPKPFRKPPKPDFASKSSLYQEFLAEREEILRHKWIESEKVGHDIGFERALLDWIRKHRESWKVHRRTILPGQSVMGSVRDPDSDGVDSGSFGERQAS